MTVAAAVVPLPSSYSCYMDVKMCQGVNKAAKVRGDGLTLPKNASGLLSNLRNFYPPLLTPSSIICCPGSVLQEVAGTSAQAAILTQNLLAEQVHLCFVVAGGWVDCGGSFSLLNLVAG